MTQNCPMSKPMLKLPGESTALKMGQKDFFILFFGNAEVAWL